jgi:hypothetical protein
MGLIDSIRKAEEKARHAYERAAHMSDDAQRRIRQRMRIYPRPVERAAASVEAEREASSSIPEPIVSISGEDVPAAELGKEATLEEGPPEIKDRRRRRNAA